MSGYEEDLGNYGIGLIERRKAPRFEGHGHFMVKIGFGCSITYLGTVRNVSTSGLLVQTDLMQYLGTGKGATPMHKGTSVILVGMERWNRHFQVSAKLVRITKDWDLGLQIVSTTSDEFLQKMAGA